MTRTTNTIWTALTAFVVFMLVSGTQNIFAQTSPLDIAGRGSFVVMPAKVEVDLMPGQTASRAITVENHTGRNATFVVSVEDISGTRSGSETVKFLGTTTESNGVQKIIQTPETTFTLTNNATANVPVALSMPLDAEPGGHYGVVFVTATPEKNAEGPSVESRIGVLFFIRMPGNQTESGSLTSFATANGKRFFTNADVPFEMQFENNGNVHLNPYGQITIKNFFGKTVATLPIDPWFVLPDSVRTREVRFEKGNAFGFYNATIELNRGYQDIIDTKKVSFVVLPYSHAGALIVILGAVIWVIWVRFIRTKRA